MFYRYLKRHEAQLAFTLVELMVTIAIIAILASIITFAALMQQKASRDTARNAKSVLIAEALEKYYDKNNEYPSVASITNQPIETVKQKLNIKDDETLVLPLAETSAIPIVRNSPSVTQVAYIASTKDPAENDQCQNQANGYCDKFTLQYRKESDDSIVSIASRHDEFISNADQCDGPCPAAPTQPTVSGLYVSSTAIRFTAANATCAAGNVQYKIRYNTTAATESAMPNWQTAAWTKSTTREINPGANKYFYFQAIARCVDGPYASISSTPSIIGTLNISPPGPPTVYASALSAYSIQLSWTGVSGATSYSVSGAGTASSCTGSPCTVSGLAASTPYTFNVRATNQYGTGNPGSASATTLALPATPAAPGLVYVSDESGTATRWNWYGVGCNVGTPEYAFRLYYPGYRSYSSQWSSTATTTVLDTSSQGYVYRLYVQARCVNYATGDASGWSGEMGNSCVGYGGNVTGSTCDYVRPIAQPITYNGWVSIGYSGTSLWGQSKVTQSTGCPVASVINFRADVKKNDILVAQYSPTYVGQTVTWPSDLDAGDKIEVQWYAWCSNPTTGKSSAWDYADIFGNAHVSVNRTASVHGKWWKSCGGSGSNPYRAPVCSEIPYDGQAVGAIAP